MKITPTVGRVVYFNPNGMQLASHLAAPYPGDPLAAIVAAVTGNVHDTYILTLAIIDATGQMFGQASVPLVQEGQPEPDAGTGFAYWMPYQLAQAGIKPMDDKEPVLGGVRNIALEASLRTVNIHGPDEALKAARAYEQYLLGQDVVPQLAKSIAVRKTTAVGQSTMAPTAAGDAPKVDATRIDALMASLTYETAHVPGTTSTVATARLPGGFVAAIGHSACVAVENFDAALGRKYAIEDAERQARGKLWSFEGYALYLRLEQLRAAGIDETMPAHQQRVMLERLELDEKRNGLAVFIATADAEGSIFDTLPQDEQDALRYQLDTMNEYSSVLSQRIAAFSKVQA